MLAKIKEIKGRSQQTNNINREKKFHKNIGRSQNLTYTKKHQRRYVNTENKLHKTQKTKPYMLKISKYEFDQKNRRYKKIIGDKSQLPQFLVRTNQNIDYHDNR